MDGPVGSQLAGECAWRGEYRPMGSTARPLSVSAYAPLSRSCLMELHKGIADMVSSQLHIAALDKPLYERVTPLISEAIKLGGETFLALQAAIQDFGAAKTELSSCNQRGLALIKKVPNEFGNIAHLDDPGLPAATEGWGLLPGSWFSRRPTAPIR